MSKNIRFTSTSDKLIRDTLKIELENIHKKDTHVKIIEELGINHGNARIDIAVINGIIHGYELKSDLDTLSRLPDQMKAYNSVFDQITIVVGKTHLYDAINSVPEWWGIEIAKIDSWNNVALHNIREATENPMKSSVSIAKLLWKEEAISILDRFGQSKGLRSKPRIAVYEKLAEILDQQTLRTEVRNCLYSRLNWRADR